MMRVCFDSRPAADRRGIGRYARCLLESLLEEAQRRGGEVVEGRQPRRHDDLFHSPWMAGALLRPRVPMVVTVHDLVQQKRPGEHLRRVPVVREVGRVDLEVQLHRGAGGLGGERVRIPVELLA